MAAVTVESTLALASAPAPDTMPAVPAVAEAMATEASEADTVRSVTCLPAVLPTLTPEPSAADVEPLKSE